MDSKEPTRKELWISFLGLIGITWFLWSSTFGSHGGDILTTLGAIGFTILTIIMALVMFKWIRVLVLVILGIWGIISIFSGLFAMSTCDFLLLMILWQLMSKD